MLSTVSASVLSQATDGDVRWGTSGYSAGYFLARKVPSWCVHYLLWETAFLPQNLVGSPVVGVVLLQF